MPFRRATLSLAPTRDAFAPIPLAVSLVPTAAPLESSTVASDLIPAAMAALRVRRACTACPHRAFHGVPAEPAPLGGCAGACGPPSARDFGVVIQRLPAR